MVSRAGSEGVAGSVAGSIKLANAYEQRGDVRLAIETYEAALRLNAASPDLNFHLGRALRLSGDLAGAIAQLETAIAHRPHHCWAPFALAQCYWMNHDLERGVPGCDTRWKLQRIDPTRLSVPLWDGSDLTGKKILIYAEQGLGDTLQFIRYARLLVERGARVTASVQKRLCRLLSLGPHIDEVEEYSEAVFARTLDPDRADFQAPIMSLPSLFGTREESIPADVPYVRADPERIRFWRRKLRSDRNVRVGVCWRVDSGHEAKSSALRKRNPPIDAFSPLAELENVTFYCLQKPPGREWASPTRLGELQLTTLGPEFDVAYGPFMDTAAVIGNLDVVVSVDSSVGHLAGALGRETYLLLPFAPDFRWHLGQSHTVWYPETTLFRQPEPGDWRTPVQQIRDRLAQRTSLLGSGSLGSG